MSAHALDSHPLPPPAPVAAHPRVGSQLHRLVEAYAAGGHRALAKQARRFLADRDGTRLRVEIEPAPGRTLADALAAAEDRDARRKVVGTTVAEVWLHPAQVLALADDPAVGRLDLPRRAQSFGSDAIGAQAIGVAPFHCAGQHGKGVHLAVVDHGFTKFAQAHAAGEVAKAAGEPPQDLDGTHGTQCAEVVSDVAPGVALHPVTVDGLAALEAWIDKELPGSGIQVISHSIGWFGLSFGDGTGKLCSLVDQARKHSAYWVTAAGNLAAGALWHGTGTDGNSDGWIEFDNADPANQVQLTGGQPLSIYLDWNAYPVTDQDLDLHLCHQVGPKCEPVAASTNLQTGTQPPFEAIGLEVPVSGTYAVSVFRKSGQGPLQVRLVVLSPKASPLEYHRADQSLADPAHCSQALAVGAVDVGDWTKGLVAPDSSQGPTHDGRIKPDLVAPTGVPTWSGGAFYGTSPAAAHVAGAIAVYMQAAGVDAPQAVTLLMADLEPPASGTAATVSGKGRLRLGFSRSHASCDPMAPGSCQTTCGTAGQASCDATCTAVVCQPPAETCDGIDQDCDGQTDETFPCSPGTTLGCDTSCGSRGLRTCAKGCVWGVCTPPVEACNGQDDDCDGQADDGLGCVLGASQACVLPGGREGLQTCGDTCGWGPCLAEETCNGLDDDGDGQKDEGLNCSDDGGLCSAGPTGRPLGLLALMLAGWAAIAVRRRRS